MESLPLKIKVAVWQLLFLGLLVIHISLFLLVTYIVSSNLIFYCRFYYSKPPAYTDQETVKTFLIQILIWLLTVFI
jgi:hypothetical protein